MNSIKGLIFDFDGLILDTETPEYEVWCDIYSRYGSALSIEDWALCLGSSPEAFDAVGNLQNLTKLALDQAALRQEHRIRSLELIERASPLPGIVELLSYARKANLPVGLASSSKRNWVEEHLKRIKLEHFFDCIFCQDDVAEVKPAPDLYLLALEYFHLNSRDAVAFEDSPNGITAAQRAGIFCVGVPNPVSRLLITDHADMIVSSLAEFEPHFLLDIVWAEMHKNHHHKEIPKI